MMKTELPVVLASCTLSETYKSAISNRAKEKEFASLTEKEIEGIYREIQKNQG